VHAAEAGRLGVLMVKTFFVSLTQTRSKTRRTTRGVPAGRGTR
jgi:hypothetical protein